MAGDRCNTIFLKASIAKHQLKVRHLPRPKNGYRATYHRRGEIQILEESSSSRD
jgi:hypothetical protein